MTEYRDAASADGREEESIPEDSGRDQDHSPGQPEPAADDADDLTPLERLEAAEYSIDQLSLDAHRQVSEKARVLLVKDGYFVNGQVPYGLKSVRERYRNSRTGRIVTRARLEPGDPQEIEVVRLVYELYGCQQMPVNHILNILRAQRIPACRKNMRWSLQKIERILTDPVYIGATRFKKFVRFDSFPPIIEPWIYYAALSRRHFERLSKWGSLVQQNDPGSSEGVADE